MSHAATSSPDVRGLGRPFLVATVTGTLASAIVRWFLYGRYLHRLPHLDRPDPSPLAYLSPYSAAVVAGWAAAFALAWKAWPSLRSDVGTIGGRIRVAMTVGTVICWTSLLLFGRAAGGAIVLDAIVWANATVAIGSSIVWSFALLGPDARVTEPSARRMRAHGLLSVALVLGLPSVRYVHWFLTSRDAGFLMILGVLLFLAALACIVISAILTAMSVHTLATTAAS